MFTYNQSGFLLVAQLIRFQEITPGRQQVGQKAVVDRLVFKGMI